MPTSNNNTEAFRRARLIALNVAVVSEDRTNERTRLESAHGRVWDAEQLAQQFEVLGFMAPYVVVKRRSDGRKRSLEFQHSPRFYFNFLPDEPGTTNEEPV